MSKMYFSIFSLATATTTTTTATLWLGSDRRRPGVAKPDRDDLVLVLQSVSRI